MKTEPGNEFEYKFGSIGWRHVLEAILLRIRRDPEESAETRTVFVSIKVSAACPIHELTSRKLEIGDQAGGRGLDGYIEKVEPMPDQMSTA